jgi:glyoxylase-like metal-dependent hydrolase (beta-lactamase superfamily II)
VSSFERGLVRVGPNTRAWLQPDGSWGWSNAGLISGESQSVLIDTLFDLRLTGAMLDAIRETTALPIATLVNTHHNGDHCYGNQLLPRATIVGHRRCREEILRGLPPSALAAARQGGDTPVALYLQRAFASFDFSGIELTPPTVVFDDALTVFAEGVEVRLMHFGPGHTLGDIVAFVPSDGVLYAGDLLFRGSTPLVWEGSISNWIDAIDRMLALGATTVVPGHGPVCGPEGLSDMQAYLRLVQERGRQLRAEGLEPFEAARKFDAGPWRDWLDSERIVLNFMRLWRELDGEPPDSRVDTMQAFAGMAELAATRGRQAPA